MRERPCKDERERRCFRPRELPAQRPWGENSSCTPAMREPVSGDAQKPGGSPLPAKDEPGPALPQRSITTDTCTAFAVHKALFLPLSLEFKRPLNSSA